MSHRGREEKREKGEERENHRRRRPVEGRMWVTGVGGELPVSVAGSKKIAGDEEDFGSSKKGKEKKVKEKKKWVQRHSASQRRRGAMKSHYRDCYGAPQRPRGFYEAPGKGSTELLLARWTLWGP
ncbi:hypothetical protein TIFTF001_029015 [Ficus carica]|uniref:Uncharacterized protein n=1 Tax=Ficus carica TaxID=3494 RepID=A0AA88DR30_FICCA|nr:hypothetical protein TIFTF001_029015 [Ficus carica]